MLETPATDLRSRLLEGALEIVNTHGAAGLTVRAVAKAAGCSTMGVYTHFSGKSGLMDAVVEWGFDSLDEALATSFDARGAGADALVAASEAFVEWGLTYPTQFQAMFVPAAQGYEPGEQARVRAVETFYGHRSRVAAALCGPDADPAPCHDAAARLWGTLHGLVLLELMHRSQAEHGVERLTDWRTAVRWAVAALEAAPVAVEA
ncbi:TetR/AcrR family transcriptional regulator [Demequina pelophila]|uniref:TetR/AcrR family transcriptional regulator n=1 Tax=Demequina pelophila TaxID=1638984 RepID=UPI000783F4C7|nr:TetR/AcrR family transcriptional regulator [Demequina pelophila]